MGKNFLWRRISNSVGDKESAPKGRGMCRVSVSRVAFWRRLFKKSTSACVFARGSRFHFAYIAQVRSHLYTALSFARSHLGSSNGYLVFLVFVSPVLSFLLLFRFPPGYSRVFGWPGALPCSFFFFLFLSSLSLFRPLSFWFARARLSLSFFLFLVLCISAPV